MSIVRHTRFVFLTMAALLIASCGNQTDQGVLIKALRGQYLGGKQAAPALTRTQLQAGISASLRANKLPQKLVRIESRNANAIMVQIEQNGSYKTWATGDRRSVTFRRGIVTATRGLGQDIMSSDTQQVSTLINGRRSGNATRAYRYLNGQNQTVTLSFDCSVNTAGRAHYRMGQVNAAAVRVVETCQSDRLTIENTYLVSSSGTVVQSRQWLGPINGYFSIELLRQ